MTRPAPQDPYLLANRRPEARPYRWRQRVTPGDAVGLDAKQRAARGQAVEQPGHVEQIAQPDLMHAAAPRAREESVHSFVFK